MNNHLATVVLAERHAGGLTPIFTATGFGKSQLHAFNATVTTHAFTAALREHLLEGGNIESDLQVVYDYMYGDPELGASGHLVRRDAAQAVLERYCLTLLAFYNTMEGA